MKQHSSRQERTIQQQTDRTEKETGKLKSPSTTDSLLRFPACVARQNSLHVHGIAVRVGAAVKAETTRLTRTKAEGASRVPSRSEPSNLCSVLVLFGKVLLDDVVGLHVNLLVRVILAAVDLLHSTSLLDVDGVAVDVVSLGSLVHLADLEDVLDAVEGHLDDFVVQTSQQVAQGPNATLIDEVADLLGHLKAAGGGIGDGPTSLLAGLEISVGE